MDFDKVENISVTEGKNPHNI